MSARDAALPYTVRESARAKRVTLRVSARVGFEVVVPRGYPRSRIPAIVAGREDWARRHLARLGEDGWTPGEAPSRPDALELRAVERRVALDAAPDPRKRPALAERGPDALTLSGDLDDDAACRELVRAWLKRQARLALGPRLRELSDDLGLPYERLQVRAQKSRWGSCSASGTISLNCTLLFLPPDLADYVLVHELCHTRHLDHSADYWSLLESILPGAKRLDKALATTTAVPPWLRT